MTDFRDIPFARPWITDEERDAVVEVLGGHILTHGPVCKAFEAEFADLLGEGAHTVSVSSCMAALHLSYLHFGIGPDDEVIVPAQTHVATAHAVEWVGATPVFVDCDPSTGNITPNAIADAITPRTKAISVVHYAGIPCEMPQIVNLAQERNLKVVEDCAIAVGARYDGKHVGLFGDVGTFSFYPVKHITTGEGGMFVSKHTHVTDAVGKLRAFGVDRKHDERKIPGLYEVPSLGLNYRMSEMQAALGRPQLERFDRNLEIRQSNYIKLKEALSDLPDIRIIDSKSTQAVNSHYCLVIIFEGKLLDKRNNIVSRLNSVGVGTSVYYPQPVPRMAYYQNKYGYQAEKYPSAIEISDNSIALPVGPHVTVEDMDYISDQLHFILEQIWNE